MCPLRVGDYVTTSGNLMNIEFLEGARAYWWVESSALHGHSSASAPYSYLDPDTNLTTDACPPSGLSSPDPVVAAATAPSSLT